MSEISYFATYDKQENQVTNNTILMFRHVYNQSPKLFYKFLSELAGGIELPEIGLQFEQQKREQCSVPDALIRQNSFNVYFELKDGDNRLDETQINNHTKAFKTNNDMLLCITKCNDPLADKEYGEENVFFTTYKKIVQCLQANTPPYLSNLYEIVESYKDMLNSKGLLYNQYQMVAFPCPESYNENIKYRYYYHPIDCSIIASDRNYIGIYHNKNISHIGQISDRIKLKDKQFFYFNDVEITDNVLLNRLREIVKTSPDKKVRDRQDHNIYLFDEMYKVNLKKDSLGGIPSFVRKHFDLLAAFDIVEDSVSSFQDLCDRLKGKTWE